MRRCIPAVVFLGVFGLVSAPSQEVPPKALDQTFTAIPWPLPHMKNLPPDYLERQRASLQAGTARLSKLRLTDAKSTDSIG
jgi:hypothetical protein